VAGSRKAACALLAACVLSACGAPVDPDEGALVVGMHELNGMPAVVSSEVLQNLVRLRPGSSDVVQDVASSWRATSSGRVWTFRLRPGLQFSDGTPLDARAVTFNFERSPGHAPSLRASAPNATTLVLTLKESEPHLLADLATPAFAIGSPTAIVRAPLAFARYPVGSGPYEIVDSVEGDHTTLVANPRFSGPAPAYRKLVFRTIPDQNTGVLAIEKNDIAVLADPRPVDLEALDGNREVTLYAAAPPSKSQPIAVSSDVAGVVPSADGALHIELWKPGGAP